MISILHIVHLGCHHRCRHLLISTVTGQSLIRLFHCSGIQRGFGNHSVKDGALVCGGHHHLGQLSLENSLLLFK